MLLNISLDIFSLDPRKISLIKNDVHRVKSVWMQSFFVMYFLLFGRNMTFYTDLSLNKFTRYFFPILKNVKQKGTSLEAFLQIYFNCKVKTLISNKRSAIFCTLIRYKSKYLSKINLLLRRSTFMFPLKLSYNFFQNILKHFDRWKKFLFTTSENKHDD